AARFVDLDGPTWLAQDVESGLDFACGVIRLGDA
ncbi:L-Ala-D/L-Glu epimerase, partial [Serratia rubidaea]|nr:L-Ala-D/L-Glu epimerase [Serratia rubidaea]